MNEKSQEKYTIQIILMTLNLGLALWSTFVFIVFLKVPVWLWLFLNICAPTQYLTCIALKLEMKGKSSQILRSLVVPLLFRFGTGGLFLFPWTGEMLMAQISHIVMTITAIFLLITSLKGKETHDQKQAIVGILIGIGLFLIIDFVVFPVVFSSPLAMDMLDSMGFAGDTN